jgi:2-desacetyl-2-hydroxyethyl bacteriochlorophyllide A dehydrogenase
MRAVVHSGQGRVRVERVDDPKLSAATDAVVRVRRAAVCGTDLHVLAHSADLPAGFVLGHEFAGEVVEVGRDVREHRVGDRVVGADYTACGHCRWCRHGDHWHCAERRFFGTGSGFGAPLSGAQAELVRVPHADVVLRALPAEVGYDAAVFLGDTLATGYAAVTRAGLRPGDTVAVVGGGPVGQLTSLAAQACGAGVVVVVEPVDGRRELAAAEGALVAVPDRAGPLVAQVSDGRGADVVVDAIGGPRGLDTAYALVRSRGRVVSVGVHTEDWALPAGDGFAREVSIQFAIGNLMRDADELLGLLRSGAIDPTVLVTDTVTLDEAPEAYRRMADRRSLKSLIST